VASDTLRRRAYYVAAMTLHAAEDKTFSGAGATIAGFGTPWGDFTNGDTLDDGYHRVWGRDLYQQAMGLIAAGDSEQALRMAQFMWNTQFISAETFGAGTTYAAGLFPRYTRSAGSAGRLRTRSIDGHGRCLPRSNARDPNDGRHRRGFSVRFLDRGDPRGSRRAPYRIRRSRADSTPPGGAAAISRTGRGPLAAQPLITPLIDWAMLPWGEPHVQNIS